MAAFAWDAKRAHESFIIHVRTVCVHLFPDEFRLFFKNWFLSGTVQVGCLRHSFSRSFFRLRSSPWRFVVRTAVIKTANNGHGYMVSKIRKEVK